MQARERDDESAAAKEAAERAAQDERPAVLAFLGRMSAAWQARRYEELAACFDERMVIAAPGFQARVEGREACVESYREFQSRVTITEYREDVPTVDVWGDTAVATYGWEMAWDAGGTHNRESGFDVFVLRRDGGASDGGASGVWRAVWRTITPAPRP